MTKVGGSELAEWRGMSAETALIALADYTKRDATFVPLKDKTTSRWYAGAGGRDFELLITGPKFFDTRVRVGGGGAIDMAMHLLRIDFRGAVEHLRRLKVQGRL
ncbi:MAG: hypothetical protein KGJ65_03205 [Betaproteobacteria bacterium]|nr:hypothetical protein [Betaproteobacteria bacterium]MDE2122669.1 hypothetical protein [Betaproteobacteria bacterium]